MIPTCEKNVQIKLTPKNFLLIIFNGGRTDEQRYAIISPYFDRRIKMNGPYPEITNISFLAKLFFKTFISLKHLSDVSVSVSIHMGCLKKNGSNM
jgi:hypothetical protein